MVLSKTLFNNLTNKFTFSLKKEKSYIKNLLNQIIYFKRLKKKDSRNLSEDKFCFFQ